MGLRKAGRVSLIGAAIFHIVLTIGFDDGPMGNLPVQMILQTKVLFASFSRNITGTANLNLDHISEVFIT
jgi:hypothetical protein